MLARKKLSLLEAVIYIVSASTAFAQVRYTNVGDKMTLGALSYSRVEGSDVAGFQVSFTHEGRVALGVLASVSSLPNPSRSVGAAAEIGIIKRHDQAVGMSLLFAAVQTWFSAKIPEVSYQSQTYQSKTLLVGVDFYFQIPGTAALPFLQASYASGSSNVGFGRVRSEVESFAIGIDFLIPRNNAPKFILTPGITLTEGKSSFAIQLAFVLSSTTKD